MAEMESSAQIPLRPAADPMAENKPAPERGKGQPKKAASKKMANETSKPTNQPKKEKAKGKEGNEKDPVPDMFASGFLKSVWENHKTSEVYTRFPPEPNGHLHIGHAKAIHINWGFSKRYGHGSTILRYDDTNPSAEKEEYFTSILDMVRWLGKEPSKITYSSDHFDKLYDLAERLIMKDCAYVCFCTDAEVKQGRGGTDHGARSACLHRIEKTPKQSLKEFRAMRDGVYAKGECFLRLKQDLESGNTELWDLAAYRILDKEHYRTGDKWRIYPTYDFAHTLCDSIEQITHSLCTTEFQMKREVYEWLCESLEVYTPRQSEYNRLVLEGALTSKRKIEKLVEAKVVRGYDDPRLYTLAGLRRRGIPPGAINSFVEEIGTSTAVTTLQTSRFEECIRTYLNLAVPRLMLILDPIRVVIDNLSEDFLQEYEFQWMPNDKSSGSHRVPFTRTIYIDRGDFRPDDDGDFRGLIHGKTVGLLKVPFAIRATSFEQSEKDGPVTLVHATTYEKPPASSTEKYEKPKGYIHWVAHSEQHGSPVNAEVRVFNPLFKSSDPNAVEGGFLNDVNPDNEIIYTNAMIEIGIDEVMRKAPWPRDAGEKDIAEGGSKPWGVRFQGMRMGYFAMDQDTIDSGVSDKDRKVVLNRTIALKEDAAKASR